MSSSPDSVSSAVFREAMSHLAAGVSVVSALDVEGGPRGMTATAVCSVSLAPPLVLASLATGTSTHDAVMATRAFAINFLGRGDEDLARRFASRSMDKFSGVEWIPGVTGCPTIPHALGVCECELDRAVAAGDHTLFVGRVLSAVASGDEPVDPLIYFRGAYTALSDACPP